MSPDLFGDPVLVWLGPFPLTRTMVTSAAISALLIVVAALLARAILRRDDSRMAALGRLTFRFLRDLVREQGPGEPGLEVSLERAPHRARAERRVVAALHDEVCTRQGKCGAPVATLEPARLEDGAHRRTAMAGWSWAAWRAGR